MTIRFYEAKGHTSDWESDFHRGSDGPSMEMLGALDSAIRGVFEETQAYTHVETGSLRASGKVSVSYNRTTHVWEGTLEYGGASAGSIYDPVRYAVYEQARGQAHNPLFPAEASEPLFSRIFSDYHGY